MTERFQLKPIEHLGTPESKQMLNRLMFATIAPKYDFITQALSFGRDAAWKRRLLSCLPESSGSVCLDIACGTGDLTRMLSERYPTGSVTGLDLTSEMLAIADKKTDASNVAYLKGTMAALPFNNGSVDIITGGYALRNAPDLNRTLDEITRILKPGGYAAFLDFSKPANTPGQAVNYCLLKVWGGLWGLLLHGNPDVYGYIADSLKLYPDRVALRECFSERGFTIQHSSCFFGGLLELNVFRKISGKRFDSR